MVTEKQVESTHWSGVLDQKESFIPIARLPLALIRFIKFCIVGGSGLCVDMGILYLMADPSRLALNITLSKIIAAEVAMINNFIWNELWTFRNPSPLLPLLGERDGVRADQHSKLVIRNSLLRRFLLFNVICGIGIGLAVLLLHVFRTWLGWNLYLSNLLAIVVVTFWNFGMNARLNWSMQK